MSATATTEAVVASDPAVDEAAEPAGDGQLFDPGKPVPDAPVKPGKVDPSLCSCGNPACGCLNVGKTGLYRLILGVDWGKDTSPPTCEEAYDLFGILTGAERKMVGLKLGVFRGTDGLTDGEMTDEFKRGWRGDYSEAVTKLIRALPVVRREKQEEAELAPKHQNFASLEAMMSGLGFQKLNGLGELAGVIDAAVKGGRIKGGSITPFVIKVPLTEPAFKAETVDPPPAAPINPDAEVPPPGGVDAG